jgi:hypothetical protein
MLIFTHCTSSMILSSHDSCVGASITLETVAFNTLIMQQFLSQMLKLNVHQQSVLFQNWTRLLFSSSLTWTVTHHNRWYTGMGTTEWEQTWEEQCVASWSYFNVANSRKYFFIIS